MFNKAKMMLMFLSIGTSMVFGATSSGYIKTLRFASGTNGINYAIISTNSPQIVSGSANYVGAEYSGVPYTLLALPSDPTLCALAGASLERARGNTAANFYFIDVAVGPNSSMAVVPGIPGNQWVNLVSNWYIGQ
jgi:hypothetical protein